MRIFSIVLLWLCLALCVSTIAGSSRHEIPAFGVSAEVPEDWTLYREYSVETEHIVSFGMPRVWGEIEQQEIENAVSISAYKSADIDSMKALLSFEEDRISNILVSSKRVPCDVGKRFLLVTEIQGISYKSLSQLRFVNGVGYVITFTATEGTYDKNLPKFMTFLESLKFSPPIKVPPVEYESRLDHAMALYRGGPANAEKVIEVLLEELEEHPDNDKARRLLGITYFGIEQFEKALECFERSLKESDGLSRSICFYKARTLYELGHYEESLQTLNAFWAIFVNDPEYSKKADELAMDCRAKLSESEGGGDDDE